MNCNCAICSDPFSPTDEIYVTHCGHVFHHGCLKRWTKRSETCPQCRKKTNEKSIQRIYFNYINTDGIELDAGTLQINLDSAEFHLKQKEKELEKCEKEKNKLEEACQLAEGRISSLETDIENKISTIRILKEKIEYMKTDTKELSRLQKRVNELTEKLEKLQRLQDIIDSTPATIESVVNKVSDPQALNMYIVVLKKAMTQTESKKKSLQESVTTLQNELQRLKSQNAEQSSEISSLESSVKYLEVKNKNMESELLKLKKRLSDDVESSDGLSKRKSDSIHDDDNSDVKTDSDRSFINTSTENESIDDRECKRLKKSNSNDTVSPYLRLKQSNGSLAPLRAQSTRTDNAMKRPDFYILKTKKHCSGTSASAKSSILEGMIQKRKDFETNYNGFGGHSKLDIFPKTSTFHVKKNFGTVVESKPKKNKRLVDFRNQNKIDGYCEQSDR